MSEKKSDWTGFDRCNLAKLKMDVGPQHDGEGDILFTTIATHKELAGPCNFIDYAELPPGTSIGKHQHEANQEEFYLVLGGEGQMWRDGETFTVRAGDLIRNRPGGTHGLTNAGTDVIRLFVLQISLPS